MLALSMSAPAMAQSGKTYYWISHGSPTDPVWTTFLQGAEQWAKDTGNTVKTSFHSGDVPSQQEAVRAAIAASAAGIVTSVPQVGQPDGHRQRGPRRGHPDHQHQHARPGCRVRCLCRHEQRQRRQVAGRSTSSTTSYVKSGDTVFTPVEVAGATYGEQEKQGIKSVFDPLGIKIDAIETGLDQAGIISAMSDYLTANKDKTAAMIGLGDLVTGSVARVWDQVGIKAGAIPVVGWGNSADTAQEITRRLRECRYWQDPQMTSYLGLSLAAAEASGYMAGGHDFLIGSLYEKDQAQTYLDVLTQESQAGRPPSDFAGPAARAPVPLDPVRTSGQRQHARAMTHSTTATEADARTDRTLRSPGRSSGPSCCSSCCSSRSRPSTRTSCRCSTSATSSPSRWSSGSSRLP